MIYKISFIFFLFVSNLQANIQNFNDPNQFFKLISDSLSSADEISVGNDTFDSHWTSSKKINREIKFFSKTGGNYCLYLRKTKIAFYNLNEGDKCISDNGSELSLSNYSIMFAENSEMGLKSMQLNLLSHYYYIPFLNLSFPKDFQKWDNSEERRLIPGVRFLK